MGSEDILEDSCPEKNHCAGSSKPSTLMEGFQENQKNQENRSTTMLRETVDSRCETTLGLTKEQHHGLAASQKNGRGSSPRPFLMFSGNENQESITDSTALRSFPWHSWCPKLPTIRKDFRGLRHLPNHVHRRCHDHKERAPDRQPQWNR